jgi:hypothetical protein
MFSTEYYVIVRMRNIIVQPEGLRATLAVCSKVLARDTSSLRKHVHWVAEVICRQMPPDSAPWESRVAQATLHIGLRVGSRVKVALERVYGP